MAASKVLVRQSERESDWPNPSPKRGKRLAWEPRGDHRSTTCMFPTLRSKQLSYQSLHRCGVHNWPWNANLPWVCCGQLTLGHPYQQQDIPGWDLQSPHTGQWQLCKLSHVGLLCPSTLVCLVGQTQWTWVLLFHAGIEKWLKQWNPSTKNPA